VRIKVKVNQYLFRSVTDPYGPRKLGLPDFQKIGT
jgi:hypothetical protein